MAVCAWGASGLLGRLGGIRLLGHIKHIPSVKIVFAFLCVALGYVSLIGYDWLCHVLAAAGSFGTVAVTAFLSTAISNMFALFC